jgi:putative PIN family toxin of toxin-antitoxin system
VIRIVLDSNVLVSALVFGGVPRAVLELAETGRCEFFYSAAIQTEVCRVLAEKFDWYQAILRAILPTVWSIGTRVNLHLALNVVPSDPDDNRILECAMAAHAHFVVSGDHHLLDLKNYKSILIVTARQFMKRFVPE